MKTAEQIYEKIRDAFLGLNTSITNFNVGSRIRSIFEAISLAIEELWFYAERIYRSLFVVTATGEDLDLRAQEMGIVRRQAQKARGWIKFTGGSGTTIPQGTVVSTNPNVDPVVEFVTLEDAQISDDGYVEVEIEAKEPGLQGNVEAGRICCLVTNVPGVDSVTNETATSGGLDDESDEELRKRCVLKWYSLSYGATENALRAWALEVEGVVEAKVVPAWQGAGTAKVLVWTKNASGKLVPASEQLVEQVQALMDERRPVTTQITVEAPEGTLVDVVVAISIKSGYNFSDVTDAVKSAVESYFDSLKPGESVLKARILAAVINMDGVENARVDAPREDVAIAEGETAILGRCLVNRWTTRVGGQYVYFE